MSTQGILEELPTILALDDCDLDDLCRTAERRYRRYPLVGPGKIRWIEAPDAVLKTVQRRLLDGLLYRIPPTRYAQGFVPGRSIVTHARAHCCREWVVTTDLADFFPSVTSYMIRRVAGVLPLSAVDRERVVQLVMLRDRLPQGAPTSPHLANLATRRMDVALGELALLRGWRYSRYADDLAFSGDTSPGSLTRDIEGAVRQFGFRLRRHKTRCMGRHRRQQVTGLVVNDGVTVPRPVRRCLRAAVHQIALDGWSSVSPIVRDQIAGRLAFAACVMPEAHEALRRDLLAACPGHGEQLTQFPACSRATP